MFLLLPVNLMKFGPPVYTGQKDSLGYSYKEKGDRGKWSDERCRRSQLERPVACFPGGLMDPEKWFRPEVCGWLIPFPKEAARPW